MNLRHSVRCALVLLASACAAPAGAPVASIAAVTPITDHHKHLISPAAAEWSSDRPLPAVELPAGLAELLQHREARWADAQALAELYTDDSILLEDREFFTRGASAIAESLTQLFGRSHRVTPIAYGEDGSTGHIAGYFSRDVADGVRHFGHVLLSVRREGDGRWRITTEAQAFPGVRVQQPLSADGLIEEMDEAGLQRALVLSVAYWFGSGERERSLEEEYRWVRAENDWTAEQAARHPDRLVAFCSVNPLREYAIEEVERCAAHAHLSGLKLHFGNSWVEVKDPAHLARVREVFRSANRLSLPIVIHLWTGPAYESEGREHAEIVLNHLLPAAPDVPVQIAHFGGGGPGYTDSALEVYADAIAAGDARTKNLYFDVATVAERQSADALAAFARRIRQVGLDRVLWATDAAPPNPAARQAWLTFRAAVPLTTEELDAIARNVAPYLRP
jgi:predicted TIM-barrel fold metal-dependent hydrolase